MPFLNTPIKIDASAFERDLAVNQRDVRRSLIEMAEQIIKISKDSSK
jgi:hypothetical protein